MQTEISKDAPVVSRRNPAGLRPSPDLKAAFGPFCANVRRLNCLTPTQKDIAVLLAKATLKRGFAFFYIGSLAQFTQVRSHEKPFAGLGKNDLSPGLAALAGFGIVAIEEKDALEAGACPVTVLTVFADVRQWTVRASDWSYLPEDERRLAEHWEACFQRFTPALPQLAVEPDLRDGLAVVKGVEPMDAPDVPPMPGRCADVSGRSECRNGARPAKARVVPTFGTHIDNTRARAADLSLKAKDSRLKINLKCWSDYSMEQKKQALIELEDCNSDDRVRELLNIILGDDVTQRDGGKWIKARWTQRARVQSLMASVVERLGMTHLPRIKCAGSLAHSYAASHGVKFLTNIFLTQ